jgi:hypothetical protein
MIIANKYSLPPPPAGYIWAFDARHVALFDEMAELANLRTCIGVPHAQNDCVRGLYVYFYDMEHVAIILKEHGYEKEAHATEKAWKKDSLTRNQPALILTVDERLFLRRRRMKYHEASRRV